VALRATSSNAGCGRLDGSWIALGMLEADDFDDVARTSKALV